MANFQRKTQSDNQHLHNLTSARFVTIDGSVTTPVTIPGTSAGSRLLRVVLATNGATIDLKDGTREIATIALDAPEQTFNFGIYIENNITYVAGGTVSATLVYE